MELAAVKTIYDVVDYFTEHPLTTVPPPDEVVTLTAAYGENASTGDLTWDVWRRDFTTSERYPFIDGSPQLMLYRQKTVDGQLYSAGIVFPLSPGDVILNVTLSDTQIEISVNKQAFFWAYDRQQVSSIRLRFQQYAPTIHTIADTVTAQMDSQTPSHSGTGLVDPDIF